MNNAASDTSDYKENLEVLREDLITTYHYNRVFQQLFCHSEERIQLLNECADLFFRNVQKLLWNTLIVNLSRLTETIGHGKKKKLTLHYLVEISKQDLPDLFEDLQGRCRSIQQKIQGLVNDRNTYIVHKKLDAVQNPNNHSPSVTLEMIDDALHDIGEFMNLYYRKHEGTEWHWELMHYGGVDSLIAYLKLGVMYEDIRTERRRPMLDFEEDSSFRLKDA